MRFTISILLSLFLTSCYEHNKQGMVSNGEAREVLVYCENVMVPPLMEIKDKFESQFNCKITLHNDCSQNLSGLIKYSRSGDIYFPASHKSFSKLSRKYQPYIIDSVFIGYNPLVVMVNKGNVAGYNGDIKTLINKNHSVIIANPESSSLGYETRKILKENNIYNDIKLNVVALSTDSRGLVKSLENKEAQIVINWRSDLLNNGNINHIEVFSIPESEMSPPKIYAGLLSTSTQKELAQLFLAYVSSEEGINVFQKYGFTKRKALVF